MSPYLTFLYRGYRVILEIEYLGQEIWPEKVWKMVLVYLGTLCTWLYILRNKMRGHECCLATTKNIEEISTPQSAQF
jgi:hypothetical protein